MLDSTGEDSFSETEAAAIAAQCDPSITPIFPVRYALTLDALTAFKNSTPDLAAPSGLGGGNHDLRRLRRGYVYIYAHSGHTGDMHTDRDGKWLVFRYETQRQDANSDGTRSDTQTSLPGAYKFTQYEWDNGTPSGPWSALPMRRYPYAFVHRDVSQVHIAYSEERWPAWFFERMAQDAGVRDTLMTAVSLVPETTEYSAPLADIANYVTGFGDQEEDPVENALRQTALQPEPIVNVVNCTNAFDNGRLVALMDPLGEILDLGRIHEVLAQSQKSYAANYAYPLTIGAAVKRHEAQIISDTEGGIMGALRNNPIVGEFSATYDALIADQQSIADSLQGVTSGIMQIILREGPGGVIEEHMIAFEGLEEIADVTQFERAEYGAFIMGQALSVLGASNEGAQALMSVVDPALAKTESNIAHTAFKTTMDVYSKLNWELSAPYVRRWTNSKAPMFDVLIETTANEIAVHWARGNGDPYFIKAATSQVSRVREAGRTAVPADQLDAFIRQSYRNLGFVDVAPQMAGVSGQSMRVDLDLGDVSPRDMITTRRFSQGSFNEVTDATSTLSISLNAESAAGLAVEGNVQRVGTGVGLVFALVIALDASRSWGTTRYTLTQPGAIAADPKVVLGAAVLDVFAATAAWGEIRNTQLFTQGVSRAIFSKLFTEGQYLRPQVASAGARNAANATAKWSPAKFLGRVAGAVGVVLSAFNAIEAFYAGDTTAMIGNTLMAIGGIVMLVAGGTIVGAIVGFVLVVIGLLLTLVSYSPIEKWVGSGFWGESMRYWGEWRHGDINNQINDAMALRNESDADHERIKEYFEREVRAYAQIMTPPTILNATSGDHAIEIDYPLADSAEAVADLDITVRIGFYDNNSQRGTGKYNINSRTSPDRLRVSFVSPGVLRAQISPDYIQDLIGWGNGAGGGGPLTSARVQCEIDDKHARMEFFSWPL